MADFATVQDLEDAWRTLTDEEEARATKLIEYASAKMRAEAPNLDADIAGDTISATVAEMVCVAIVKRAMTIEVDGVTAATDTVGQVSQARTFANPMGYLYLTPDEYRLLGVKPAGNRAVNMAYAYAEPTPYCPDGWPA